jgi:hypothetical protein
LVDAAGHFLLEEQGRGRAVSTSSFWENAEVGGAEIPSQRKRRCKKTVVFKKMISKIYDGVMSQGHDPVVRILIWGFMGISTELRKIE